MKLGLVSKHTAPFPRKPYQQCGIQRLTIEPATYSKYYTRWQLFAIPASARSAPGSCQVSQAAFAVPHHDPTLPPLPEKLCSKITKCGYIDFNELWSGNMYPHPSFASCQNNFTVNLDPQEATTLAFVPS